MTSDRRTFISRVLTVTAAGGVLGIPLLSKLARPAKASEGSTDGYLLVNRSQLVYANEDENGDWHVQIPESALENITVPDGMDQVDLKLTRPQYNAGLAYTEPPEDGLVAYRVGETMVSEIEGLLAGGFSAQISDTACFYSRMDKQ